MATEAKTFAERRFAVGEYHRMAEAGILSPDERVELIHGTVRSMTPKNRAHVIATRRLFDFLVTELAGRASVYKEDPLVLPELDSEPEPDVMICSNPNVEAYGTDATAPLLVVEVAHTSLGSDLGEKASLYAQAGIPEYWVVNLVEGVLVVLREPRDRIYQTRTTLERGDSVALETWPHVRLEVASLFPEETGNR